MQQLLYVLLLSTLGPLIIYKGNALDKFVADRISGKASSVQLSSYAQVIRTHRWCGSQANRYENRGYRKMCLRS